MEALRAGYKLVCEEECAVRAQLETARLDAQQLRVRLRASGVQDDASLIPANLRAGGGHNSAESAIAEHRSLLEWLAEIVDTSGQTAFYAPGQVSIGEHKITLGRMVQFNLSGPVGGLKLNAPAEFAQELFAILARMRRGALGQAELWQLAESWELIGADVTSGGEMQPAIFMVHRESSQAVVVASWPLLQEDAAMHTPAGNSSQSSIFEPAAHFGLVSYAENPALAPRRSAMVAEITFVSGDGSAVTLTRAIGGGILWSVAGSAGHRVEDVSVHFTAADQCTITGPFGPTLIAAPSPGPLQRDLARHVLVMATQESVLVRCEHESRALVPSATASDRSTKPAAADVEDRSADSAAVLDTVAVSHGDRVEVEYQGEWFRGVLQRIEGNVAHVRCDVDEPSVITLTHISNVRPVVRLPRRHTRSNSWACP